MGKYVIITDSTTDLPPLYQNEQELVVIPLKYNLGGKEYLDYLDHREYSITAFYNEMRNGAISKTSQINSQTFYDIFKKYLDEGYGILALIFSSALSGTYNSARLAKDELLEENKEAQIELIDSKCASMGEGLLVYYGLKALKEGKTLQENKNYLEDLKLHIIHYFTVDTLTYLYRGGRVSASSAFIANALQIKPILNVNDKGELIPRLKKIGRKNSLKCLIEHVVKEFDPSKNDVIFISHGDALGDAFYVRDELEKALGFNNFVINYIGPVIGSHSGPGTIAVFYLANNR